MSPQLVSLTMKLLNFNETLDAAFVFFLLAIVYTAVALYLFCAMLKNELYQTYVNKKTEPVDEQSPSNRDEETKLMNKDTEAEAGQLTFRQFIQSTLWPYMLSVFLVFAVTLGLFPGAAAFIKPAAYDCTNTYHTKYFVPLWCFTLYNVTDTIGRWFAGKIDFPKVGEVIIFLLENMSFHMLF